MRIAQEHRLGIPLGFYTDALHRVPVHLNKAPFKSFDAPGLLASEVWDYFEERAPDHDALKRVMHRLPWDAFSGFSLDQLCKIRESATNIELDSSVIDVFKNDPRFEIVNKIRSSLWRWGYYAHTWNEIVDAYDGLRQFDLGLPGFEARIDHTTYLNERGYSKYTRTFLDGVFAYNVLYEGRHVMTIGFSITGRRRVLLQQIQLTRPRGNRWLFRFPANRVEFAIERLQRAFQKHQIYVVDGLDATNSIIENYGAGLRDALERVDRGISRVARARPDEVKDAQGYLDRAKRDVSEFQEKIASLQKDIPRINAFYAATGRYRQTSRTYKWDGLLHYHVAA